MIAPVGEGADGEEVLHAKFEMPDGNNEERAMRFGEIVKIPLAERREAKAVITPSKGFDIGAGPGKRMETIVEGGTVGIFIDARGRPLALPEEEHELRGKLVQWFSSLDLYPKDKMESLLEK